MNKNFILRSGKYGGKTLGWLQENDNKYLIWVEENHPEMLKGSDEKEPQIKPKLAFRDSPIMTIVPNMNFDNEGPCDYLKNKMKDLS